MLNLEYRMIEMEIWNEKTAVKRLRDKMNRYRPLFEDMITPENNFSYDDILVIADPHSGWGKIGGLYDTQNRCIWISARALRQRPNITLLHEMIHLHESMMSDKEKDLCQSYLYYKLVDQIPDLPDIMEQKDDLMEQLCNGVYDENTKRGHSNLFFLKSLDIDLHFKKKYDLGTVGGYGFDVAIKEIQRGLYADPFETLFGYSCNELFEALFKELGQ